MKFVHCKKCRNEGVILPKTKSQRKKFCTCDMGLILSGKKESPVQVLVRMIDSVDDPRHALAVVANAYDELGDNYYRETNEAISRMVDRLGVAPEWLVRYNAGELC